MSDAELLIIGNVLIMNCWWTLVGTPFPPTKLKMRKIDEN
jgi:hypothetical protein